MFDNYAAFNSSYANPTISRQPGQGPRPQIEAAHEFNRALNKGRLAHVWSVITHKSNWLINLHDQPMHFGNCHSLGMRPVPIDLIIGTEGRSQDFDSSFNPLNEQTRSRWQSVAEARLKNVPLPAVELVKAGCFYFVRDGHHRISVAKALGQTVVDAEVIEYQVKEELPWESGRRCD
jgi:hypothetical protein